ncbi:hypothetical protein C7B61_04315 [filamentous cyanobacterium CCP1]|nr:hypothetical protein C7B76_20415 [filamentous cyanobacterium CCP2]PSB67789.1 hypothetical protein C7B61_04315 [filamentous cyanobacterium CCP1]
MLQLSEKWQTDRGWDDKDYRYQYLKDNSVSECRNAHRIENLLAESGDRTRDSGFQYAIEENILALDVPHKYNQSGEEIAIKNRLPLGHTEMVSVLFAQR